MAVNNPRVIVAPHELRSVFNNSGATLAQGRVVKLSAATDDVAILPAAIADPALGVVTKDIPDQTWGTVQIRGRCAALAGTGGVTRGDKLTHDAANFGRLSTAAPAGGTNNALVALATRTAAAGVLVEVELVGPGVIYQG